MAKEWRWERREKRSNKDRSRMKADNRTSIRLIQQILIERAKQLRKNK